MHSFVVVEDKSYTNAGNLVDPLQKPSVSEFPSTDDGTIHQILGRGNSEGQIDPSPDTSQKRRINSTQPMVIESPDWLPKGWITEVKSRGHGLTAGTRDKYYVDPVAGHRFRSKPEVLRFLDGGQVLRAKPKSKSKLRGYDSTENNEAQPLAPTSSLHTPDVNSAIRVINQPRAEPNDESNTMCNQNGGDTSTCDRATKELSISTSFPLAGVINQLSEAAQSASPVEVKANEQDDLSQQYEKNKLGNHRRKSKERRKHHYPGSVEEKQEQDGLCHVSVHQHLNEECNLRCPGIFPKRQRIADSSNGPIEMHGTVFLNEDPDDTICKPPSLFPAASGSQFVSQGHDLISSGDSLNEHKISDALLGSTNGKHSSGVCTAAVLNHGPQDTVHKPFKACPPARRIQSTEHCLTPAIICNLRAQSAEGIKMEGNPTSSDQLPSSGVPSSNTLANCGSCSIPDPCSPCSVLQHNSLRRKQPSKQKPRISKLIKLKPQEIKRQLVSLGREVCKQGLAIAHTPTAKSATI